MAQIWIALPVPGGRALPDVGSWEGIPIKGKHPRRENQLLKSRSSTQAIFSRLNQIGEMWSKVIEYFQEKSEMDGVNYWRAKTLAILCYKQKVDAKLTMTLWGFIAFMFSVCFFCCSHRSNLNISNLSYFQPVKVWQDQSATARVMKTGSCCKVVYPQAP